MASAFFTARLASIETRIVAYETALLAIGDAGGTQSYTLDTGQSRQTVTRADIPALNKMLDSLINLHTVISARCNGGGTVIARPFF